MTGLSVPEFIVRLLNNEPTCEVGEFLLDGLRLTISDALAVMRRGSVLSARRIGDLSNDEIDGLAIGYHELATGGVAELSVNSTVSLGKDGERVSAPVLPSAAALQVGA